MHAVPIPDDLAAGILDAYPASGPTFGWPCGRRASARMPKGRRSPGMNETFTNVAGNEQLLTRVVDCWASLWGARSIFYRGDKELTAEPAIAVVSRRWCPRSAQA